MTDHGELTVSGTDINEFGRSVTKAIQALPAEAGKVFKTVISKCYVRYGVRGTYERLNNQTVATILAENSNLLDEIIPTRTGEINGVRFELYEQRDRAPKDRVDDAER